MNEYEQEYADSEVMTQLRDQIRDLQNQVMTKTEQNRELRHKLEDNQGKFNKAFSEKAEMHELYLNLKQELIEKKQEISTLKMSADRRDQKDKSGE